LIFVTVGSMFPFDRLMQLVDDLVESGEISMPVEGQIGAGKYEPRHFPFERFLDKNAFDLQIKRCTCVISHAGIGTISTASALSKPLIVLPRLARFSEHVNDHQMWAAKQYSESGQVIAAYSKEDISEALRGIVHFKPKPRIANAQGIVDAIATFIKAIQPKR
jgi:beta-1,4-N-acetylglucosaminyltransferase